MKTSIVALGLLSVPATWAWGSLGHKTVASIASHFVTPSTEVYFKELLRDENSTYLSHVAAWADAYRYTKAGRFSSNFHFIDAKDDPPNSCNVDYDRDCKASGCVVSAIANYTGRLLDTKLPFWERSLAAKFVIHFVGDTHQPLHDENVALGGNRIHITFQGLNINLHHFWDSTVADEMNGGHQKQPEAQASRWASELVEEIESGKFADEKESWLKGMNILDPKETVMAWATEANSYVCSHVMPKGPEAIRGQELSGDYLSQAKTVVEVQVARAGYRLAKWLDLIVDAISSQDRELQGDGYLEL